jgi:hypothetical protein
VAAQGAADAGHHGPTLLLGCDENRVGTVDAWERKPDLLGTRRGGVPTEGRDDDPNQPYRGAGRGAAPVPVVFRADHPFLVLLRHNPSGTILFFGRVMNPTVQ